MELKNYKRVSTGSEFRDVVQTAPDEPRFRANGHKLVFDSANSDYVSFPSFTLQDGQSIKQYYLFDTSNQGSDYFIFNGSQNEFLIHNNGTNFHVRDIESNNYFFTDTTVYSSKITVELTLNGGVYELFVNGVSKGTNNKLGSDIVFNQINKRGAGIAEIKNIVLYDFTLNNETFNPTDINSNAQIEGSLGTVATVNTSHASGNSYILGTVFQKSSFALAFDKANGEWLNLNQTFSIENEGDYVEFDVFLTKVTPQVEIILSEGDTGLNLGKFTDGTLYIDGFLNTLIVVDGLNTIRIEILGGNKVVTLNGLSQTQGTSAFKFSQIAKRTTTYTNMKLYSLTINGTNYPLTEGLGNTTNGATINTSHADGIKRINFGMWLKGNDIDGWTPYTIV